MVSKTHITLAAALSILTANLYAYTDIKAPTVSINSEGTQRQPAKTGTAVSIENTATIASKLKYRGVNLSANKPGLSNELKGSFHRGPLESFLKIDLFGYSADIANYGTTRAATNNPTDGGGTMIGTSIGWKLFLNQCRDSSAEFVRSIYQWPGVEMFTHNGADLVYNSTVHALGPATNIKPVKTTSLEIVWRSYHFLASTADTTSMSASQLDKSISRWPFTWDDYLSVETPNFDMNEKIKMKARYGYWKSNGIEINADFTYPVSQKINSILRVYSFKSFQWTQSDKIGIVLMMKFKTAEKLHITLPSICG